MPLIRAHNQIVYFAHVPKCGGGSVEAMLREAFGAVGFCDRAHHRRGERRWGRVSPQHMTFADLTRVLPHNFIDYSFAVIRDPVDRFVSAFNYNRIHSFIPWYSSVDGFIKAVRRSGDFLENRLDNHFMPASAFVPESAEVFRLENGFELLRNTLSLRLGREMSSVDIPVKNKVAYGTDGSTRLRRIVKKLFQPSTSQVSESVIEQIKSLYAIDYQTFGIDRNGPNFRKCM